MPNEIYPISHFGISKENGFGSIYHSYTNEPEEPIVVTPPIVINPPVVVVPVEPEEPEEPTRPKKK